MSFEDSEISLVETEERPRSEQVALSEALDAPDYFLTGLRRCEVIGLRGKDLEVVDGALVIKYRRKGEFTACEVSDPAAPEALTAYLKAAGRLNVLGSERPLWTRHDRAGKPGAPLSSRLRREPEGLRQRGGTPSHPSAPDPPHLRAHRRRGDRQIPGGAGGPRP